MLRELGLKMGLKLRRLGGKKSTWRVIRSHSIASNLARNAHRYAASAGTGTLQTSVGDTFHVRYCVKPQVSL